MKAAVLAALVLGGCSYRNNYPTADSFIRPAISDCVEGRFESCVSDQVVHVFADKNGTFYPAGWQGHSDLGRRRRAYSLFGAARRGSDARTFVELEEDRQLAEIAALARGDGRIFILVHGYNNTTAEADGPFRMLERRLDIRPNDRIIRFYWDGMTSGNFGAGHIWFWATGNSKLVGARGLRQILNQFHRRQIFLLAHSRGTSVVLSALSNPIYHPGFYRATRELGERLTGDAESFVHPPALLARNNDIHVLAAAPAVGRIDFCDAALQPANHSTYRCPDDGLRRLDPQVRSLRFTVNSADPVLNKFVGASHLFNPTNMGVDGTVGRELCRSGRYDDLLIRYTLGPSRDHSWTWYVAQPGYARMLWDAGILRAASAPHGTQPGRSACDPD